MKWIIAIITVEAIVKIWLESSLFDNLRAWLSKKHWLIEEFVGCGWCLSVWVAGVVFVFVCIGLWWLFIPFAVHRASNYLHDIDGLIKRSGWRK